MRCNHCAELRSGAVEFKVGYSGKVWGYTWWDRKNGYRITIHLNTILAGILKHRKLTPVQKYAEFQYQFLSVELHELLHALGWQTIKFPGYSSQKAGHFKWVDEKLAAAVFDCWADDDKGDAMRDYTVLFRDVGHFIKMHTRPERQQETGNFAQDLGTAMLQGDMDHREIVEDLRG